MLHGGWSFFIFVLAPNKSISSNVWENIAIDDPIMQGGRGEPSFILCTGMFLARGRPTCCLVITVRSDTEEKKTTMRPRFEYACMRDRSPRKAPPSSKQGFSFKIAFVRGKSWGRMTFHNILYLGKLN